MCCGLSSSNDSLQIPNLKIGRLKLHFVICFSETSLKRQTRAWGCCSGVEHLSSMCKTVSFIPTTAQRKGGKEEREEVYVLGQRKSM